MPPLDRRVSVEIRRLREAVRARVEETSQRQAAQEIGISATGLRGFLAGAEPYGPNLLKLSAWYEWSTEGVELQSLFQRTAQNLPEEQRKAALSELRRIVREWAERWGEASKR
jgi:hypothetical protein